MIKENYVFCQMSFNKFYGQDRSLEQAFDITNFPSDVNVDCMICYANVSTDNRGAALSIAHIENGHLSCTNPDSLTFTANRGTFFQFFAVRGCNK